MDLQKDFPNFVEFLNEGSSDQKTIGFDHLNGVLKIHLKFQETEGYDTMKPVSQPDAEIRLSFSDKDSGIIHYYNSSNYEEDREKLLNDIKDAADEFDTAINKIFEKRNFTK